MSRRSGLVPLVIVLFAVAAVACEGKLPVGENGDVDGGVAPGPDVAYPPALPDASLAGPASLTENEADGAHTDDTPATAIDVPLTTDITTVDGNIGSYGTGDDLDFYHFTGQAGQVVRLTLSARGGGYQPYADVVDSTGRISRKAFAVSADPASDAARSIYIPADGDYYVEVRDLRNTLTPSGMAGGPAVDYRLFLQLIPLPAPTAETLPAAVHGTLPPDFPVVTFTATMTSGRMLTATTHAIGADQVSGIDTVVYLVDQSGSAPAVLDTGEDASRSNHDSVARALIPRDGTYLIVLDAAAIYGPGVDYEIDLADVDPTVETEPDDNIPPGPYTPPGYTPTDTSWPLVIDTTVHASINGGDPTVEDIDFYSFTAPAGMKVDVVVTKTANADPGFDPEIQLIEPSAYSYFNNPNSGSPAAGVVHLEADTVEAGVHWIRVADARNDVLLGTFYGGPSFTYDIVVHGDTPSPTALTGFPIVGAATSTLAGSGQLAWFDFTIPAGAPKSVWIDLDQSPAAGNDGFAIDPIFVLYTQDGQLVTAVMRSLLAGIVLDPGNYVLAVGDRDGRVAPGHQSFRPRLTSAYDLVAVTDDGSHVAAASALAVTTPAAVITGTLVAGGASWFALGSQTAGSTLDLFTDSPGMTATDTRLTLYAADGTTVIASNNDDSGRAPLSGIYDVPLPSTQAYFVVVDGGTPTAAGPWLLTITPGGCPGVSGQIYPRDLGINEVFASPGTTGGDANGDGTTDANDRFVEVVNFAGESKDISGLMIRDATGVRFRAACGTQLGDFHAFAVFQGCDGAACAGQLLANVDPDAPFAIAASGASLGLGAGDQLQIIEPGGTLIDSVTVGAGTTNVSWARGSGGVCDEPPTADATQPHLSCTAPPADGGFSPGKHADGSAFNTPAPPPGDVCGTATALAAGTTAGTLAAYHRDYSDTDCTGHETDGPDRAYTIDIPAGRKLSVTVTPLDADFDPAIYLLPGPASSCAANPRPCLSQNGNTYGPGVAETVGTTNSGATDETVYLVVDSFSPTGGAFNVTVTFTAP